VLSFVQNICGNGSCAVVMVSRFEKEISKDVGRYCELFREAEVVGQGPCLQTEIVGFRIIRIECNFAHLMHILCGIRDELYQSKKVII
jgi:hypothetical protein